MFFCPRYSETSNNSVGKGLRKRNTKIKMPTNYILKVLDEAKELGFKGFVSFHHLSEPFFDERLVSIAWEARKRGMRPFINTNGDILRIDKRLCKQACEVFEYINIGLYDRSTAEQIQTQKSFWINRLNGTKLGFSMAAQVPEKRILNDYKKIKNVTGRDFWSQTHRSCCDVINRFVIHYSGNVALCCEDVYEDFNLGNVFDTHIKDIWFSKKHLKIVKNWFEENEINIHYVLDVSIMAFQLWRTDL